MDGVIAKRIESPSGNANSIASLSMNRRFCPSKCLLPAAHLILFRRDKQVVVIDPHGDGVGISPDQIDVWVHCGIMQLQMGTCVTVSIGLQHPNIPEGET